MRPDMVAGPIDRKWSRSNSWATGTLWAASVLEASDTATAAVSAYGRSFIGDSSGGAEGNFASAANLALRLGGGETCRVLPRHRVPCDPGGLFTTEDTEDREEARSGRQSRNESECFGNCGRFGTA